MPTPQLPRALFLMDPVHLPALFPPRLMARLTSLARLDSARVVQAFTDPAVAGPLAEAEVLITGWGRAAWTSTSCPRRTGCEWCCTPRAVCAAC